VKLSSVDGHSHSVGSAMNIANRSIGNTIATAIQQWLAGVPNAGVRVAV
jgi:hypothetical protein